MSYPLGSQFVQAAAQVLTSTADILTFTPVVPVEIVSFGGIVTTALDDGSGGGGVIKLDKRVTAGSDTGRGNVDLGTLTLTNAQAQPLVLPAGSVIRSRPDQNSDSFESDAPLSAALAVLPGEQAVMEVTDALASAGTINAFIEYKVLPKKDRATTIELIVTA